MEIAKVSVVVDVVWVQETDLGHSQKNGSIVVWHDVDFPVLWLSNRGRPEYTFGGPVGYCAASKAHIFGLDEQ